MNNSTWGRGYFGVKRKQNMQDIVRKLIPWEIRRSMF